MATKNSPPPVNKKNTPVENSPQAESVETSITQIVEKTFQNTTQPPNLQSDPQNLVGASQRLGAGENNNVSNKVKGLPMRELIAAPLIAVCEAQQQLAATALDFYKQIAFEDKECTQTRLIKFDLSRPVQTAEGLKTNSIKVNAPFIGLVPIPSLLIEAVNIDFQMEVTDATTSKSLDTTETTVKADAKWWLCSVDVQGKVGTSRETTRSTNQTAKYQVHVTAGQQKPTEGLSKLMDIMASCIEPIAVYTPEPKPEPKP